MGKVRSLKGALLWCQAIRRQSGRYDGFEAAVVGPGSSGGGDNYEAYDRPAASTKTLMTTVEGAQKAGGKRREIARKEESTSLPRRCNSLCVLSFRSHFFLFRSVVTKRRHALMTLVYIASVSLGPA